MYPKLDKPQNVLTLTVSLMLVLLLTLTGCSRIEDSAQDSSSDSQTSATQTTDSAGDSDSGSSSTGEAAGGSKYIDGGTLTWAAKSGMRSWNPISSSGDSTTQRQQQWPFYPHPFLFNADGSVTVNEQLLESAQVIQDDPMVVEYVIRDEAVWSDGTPISADDFKYTQAVQDPRQCANCKAAFTSGYSTMSDVKADTGSKTFTVTFEKPFAQWQQLFNYILPAHIASEYGDLETSFNVGFSENPPKVSGGPYLMSEYKDDVSMTLTRNPKWYGNPAHIETIIVRYIKKSSEQLTALQSGEVDMIYLTPNLDLFSQVDAMAGIKVSTAPTLTYYHLGMKVTGDTMEDPVLRKAIAQAINLGDIHKRTIGQVTSDVPLMTSAAFAPGQKYQGVDASQDTLSKLGIGSGDIEAAKATLETGGYSLKDGKLYNSDGEAVRDLSMVTLSTDPFRMDMAQLVQSYLSEIGITVIINAVDGSQYSPTLRSGGFDIMATGTAPDLGSLSLGQWYQTGAARSFGYSKPEVDALFEELESELDANEYVAKMNELDEYLIGDGAVLPLFGIPRSAIHRDNIHNVYVNPSKYGFTMNIEEWALSS